MAGLLYAQARKNEVNDLSAGIAAAIVQREPLFNIMPFINTGGDLYQYTRELAIPTGAFVADDGTISDGSVTFTEATKDLTTIASQADVTGMSVAKSRNSNAVAVATMACAKGVRNKFLDALITGDGTSNAFIGLRKMAIDDSRDDLATSHANGNNLSLSILRTALDSMKLGCDAIIMSFREKTELEVLYDALGGTMPQTVIEGYGPVLAFNGIPVLPSDHVAINETQGTSTDCGRIHFVKFDPVDGFAGLHAGQNLGIKRVFIDALEAKDNAKVRVVWYCAAVNHSAFSVGSVLGISPTAAQ